jgi:hypothetical protein
MTQPAHRTRGKDRSFISDEGFRNATYDGTEGFIVKVRLTSYRSLPLSCIAGIELSVDGEPVAPDTIRFLYNGYSHRLDELPGLHTVWWFILDYAELFVARPGGLAAGTHEVAGTLITVEPYITAGRFSFFNSATKQLIVDADD